VSVALALAAALAYGISDFLGGLASRRERAVRVLVVSYPVGVALVAPMLLLSPGHLDAAGLAWSVAAGLAGAAGVVLLYLGLAAGPMGVVAPLAAVASAVVPLGVGLALGERPPPLAYAGVSLALLAVVLVSRGPQARPEDAAGGSTSGGPRFARTDDAGHARVTVAAIGTALLAGVGFGLYFVLLDRTAPASGLWPLVVSRAAAGLVVLGVAVATGMRGLPARGTLRLAVLAGVLDAAANLAYLLAVRQGLLALVAVLTALYPAATILLARLVLGERTGSAQRIGLAFAGASVALIALAG
jgi:drug/metabolite transporter (DMT)-like permease